MRHLPLRLIWSPLDIKPLDSERSQARLARVLRSWDNTPYAAGQGHRGVGTDCVRSVVLILCEWARKQAPDIDTLPPDAALHSRESAIVSMRAIMEALSESCVVQGCTVMPGDVIVVGSHKGGPGHAIIVGAEQNTLWQSTPAGAFATIARTAGIWSVPSASMIICAVPAKISAR